MADTIRYELTQNVAQITLDDGKVNAMTLEFFEALNAAFDRAEKEDARALIIAGRAGAFSAGLNLKVMPTLDAATLHASMIAFGRTMLRAFTLPIPTVAAVTGHAVAGGAVLALACDLRVMAEGAFRLHLNEVAIGLALPTWALTIARSGIPRRWHTEALLHARPHTPAEALERGMIDAMVPADGVLAAAREAAAPLTRLDPDSYRRTKQRHRAMEVKWASDLLEHEMLAVPGR